LTDLSVQQNDVHRHCIAASVYRCLSDSSWAYERRQTSRKRCQTSIAIRALNKIRVAKLVFHIAGRMSRWLHNQVAPLNSKVANHLLLNLAN
jgi:hypothetical protein